MVANDLVWWFPTEVTTSTGSLSVCADKASEPVLLGAVLVSAVLPVIFFYKLLASRIIYILIRAAQPSPMRGKQLIYFLLAGFRGNSLGRLAEPLNQNKVPCRPVKSMSSFTSFALSLLGFSWGPAQKWVALSSNQTTAWCLFPPPFLGMKQAFGQILFACVYSSHLLSVARERVCSLCFSDVLILLII